MIAAALLVGIGGALGSSLRYAVTVWARRRGHPNWPWATLLVNIVGSFILGVLVVHASDATWLLAGVGFCGGLTTFSTFAADALLLAQARRRGAAASYAVVSVAAGMTAFVLGHAIARAMGGG